MNGHNESSVSGTALKSPKINAGKWLRWAYENLSEHHYLLMLRAHRAGRASR